MSPSAYQDDAAGLDEVGPMDLVSMILGLPFAPLRGVIAVGNVVQEQVDQELHGSTSTRRDLDAAAEAERAGEIGGEEKTEIQRRAIERTNSMARADPEVIAMPNPRDPRRPPADEDLSAEEVAEAALKHLASLTGKQVVGVTAVAPADDGWTVQVEVIEDHRIPSASDILAVYEARLDSVGDLLSYRRTRRYGRGRSDLTNGVGS